MEQQEEETVVRVRTTGGPTLEELGLANPEKSKRKREEGDVGPTPLGDDPAVLVSQQDGGVPDVKKARSDDPEAELEKMRESLVKLMKDNDGLDDAALLMFGEGWKTRPMGEVVDESFERINAAVQFLLKCGQYDVVCAGAIRKTGVKDEEGKIAKLFGKTLRLAHEVFLDKQK